MAPPSFRMAPPTFLRRSLATDATAAASSSPSPSFTIGTMFPPLTPAQLSQSESKDPLPEPYNPRAPGLEYPQLVPKVPRRTRYGIHDTWAANQRVYNAAHFPSTPCPPVYKLITRVTNTIMDLTFVVLLFAFLAIVFSGAWLPWAINYNRRKMEKKYAALKGEIN